MWNLRWQVQGFLQVRPDATQDELVQRFASGATIKGNEIRRACVDNSWEDQEQRFSLILFTNTIAIFEEFLDIIVGLTMAGETKLKVVKALQYPVGHSRRDYSTAYNALGATVPELVDVFRSPDALGRWYSGSKIQNLLLCYRFFKEIRNSWIHNGGRATQGLMDAYAAFLPVATPAQLGVKEVPRYTVPTLNVTNVPHLRGAYGFSDIVLRIIATYDRDLSDRRGALVDINSRLGRITGVKLSHTLGKAKHEKLIKGLFQRALMPPPKQTAALLQFLERTGRVPSHW
jgi:hypothetical protein